MRKIEIESFWLAEVWQFVSYVLRRTLMHLTNYSMYVIYYSMQTNKLYSKVNIHHAYINNINTCKASPDHETTESETQKFN